MTKIVLKSQGLHCPHLIGLAKFFSICDNETLDLPARGGGVLLWGLGVLWVWGGPPL